MDTEKARTKYVADLMFEFAKYGFITCPLTYKQIIALYKAGVSLDEAYEIGCDVHCEMYNRFID